MNASTIEAAPGGATRPALQALIRRFHAAPMGPYDTELQAFLMPLRNLPAAGKHALMRLPQRQAWTLVQLGGRGRPVQVVGGCFDTPAQAEWALFRARWQQLHGWDPQSVVDGAATTEPVRG